MHSLRQQKSPAVVATAHTKPPLQRGSLGSLGSPSSPLAQSVSEVHDAVQDADVSVTFSAPGKMQIRVGHSSAGLVIVAIGPPGVPASSSTPSWHGRPMWSGSAAASASVPAEPPAPAPPPPAFPPAPAAASPPPVPSLEQPTSNTPIEIRHRSARMRKRYHGRTGIMGRWRPGTVAG